MGKIFLALTSIFVLLVVPAFAQNISAGSMNVYNFENIKLHSYSTNDKMNDHCYIIESPEGLVLIESTAYKENVKALNDYINSLNKPLTAVLFSYHPNGYKTYGDIKIYATEKALKSWQDEGSVKNITNSFVISDGDKVAGDLPEEAEIINEGQTLNLAGVDFNILRSTDGEGYEIEIPSINAIYRHMMGSKTHSILPSIHYIEAEIKDLKNYQAKKYNLILTGHNAPESQKAVAEKIEYLEKVLDFAKTSKNAMEFTAKVKEAFPDYKGEMYLAMTSTYLLGTHLF